MSSYAGLEKYLSFITDEYELSLCFNDYSGLLSLDSELNRIMQPYLIHNNAFCMAIKSKGDLWHRCLKMKSKIKEKAVKERGIYGGMCYCGIYEFVVPLFHEQCLVGVIFAGEYRPGHLQDAYQRIDVLEDNYDINGTYMKQLYEKSTTSLTYSKEDMANRLQLVADYLIHIYDTVSSNLGELDMTDVQNISTEQYILNHALEFIKQNYNEQITLRSIATFCHCSESHLSHLFKKNIGINLRSYVNQIRLEKAKYLLCHEQLTIGDIALKVGYNDPNYFTSLFKEHEKITPTGYRKLHK